MTKLVFLILMYLVALLLLLVHFSLTGFLSLDTLSKLLKSLLLLLFSESSDLLSGLSEVGMASKYFR